MAFNSSETQVTSTWQDLFPDNDVAVRGNRTPSSELDSNICSLNYEIELCSVIGDANSYKTISGRPVLMQRSAVQRFHRWSCPIQHRFQVEMFVNQ